MRIVVTFDTPYDGWEHPDHERQMATEVAAWKHDEPEMEYQIAEALRVKGHDVLLVGVRNDLQYLVRCLDEIRPDLVFNGVESFHGNAGLEYMIPGVLQHYDISDLIKAIAPRTVEVLNPVDGTGARVQTK